MSFPMWKTVTERLLNWIDDVPSIDIYYHMHCAESPLRHHIARHMKLYMAAEYAIVAACVFAYCDVVKLMVHLVDRPVYELLVFLAAYPIVDILVAAARGLRIGRPSLLLPLILVTFGTVALEVAVFFFDIVSHTEKMCASVHFKNDFVAEHKKMAQFYAVILLEHALLAVVFVILQLAFYRLCALQKTGKKLRNEIPVHGAVRYEVEGVEMAPLVDCNIDNPLFEEESYV